MLLVGHAECFLVGQPDIDATITRLPACAAAGADVLSAPGIQQPAHIRALVAAVAPKTVNPLVGSPSPMTVADIAAMGVRRISVGGALARSAWAGLRAPRNRWPMAASMAWPVPRRTPPSTALSGPPPNGAERILPTRPPHAMALTRGHLVILVPDLHTAITDYRSLGFTVQPGGTHADGGTHNALVVFANGARTALPVRRCHAARVAGARRRSAPACQRRHRRCLHHRGRGRPGRQPGALCRAAGPTGSAPAGVVGLALRRTVAANLLQTRSHGAPIEILAGG